MPPHNSRSNIKEVVKKGAERKVVLRQGVVSLVVARLGVAVAIGKARKVNGAILLVIGGVVPQPWVAAK
jgi:hypothetical protein